MTGNEPQSNQPDQPWQRQPDQPGQQGQSGQPGQPWQSEQPGYGQPQSYPPPGSSQPGQDQPGYGTYPSYSPYPSPDQYPAQGGDLKGQAIGALVANIAATVLCCPLVGIAGIVVSAIAMSRSTSDLDSARKLLKWAWGLLIGAVVGGIIVGVIYFFVLGAELQA